MKLQIPLVFGCWLLLTACASQADRDGTVRVCDSDGCSERSTEVAVTEADDSSIAGQSASNRLIQLKALARSDPAAAYDLALRYFRGDGVRQDSAKALEWMRAAAERGNLDAQKALGQLYLTGLEEMGADPREAQLWLSVAAERGDAESRELLAEAVQARRDEAAYFEWKQRRREFHRIRWEHRYPYLWRWHDGRWYRHPPLR